MIAAPPFYLQVSQIHGMSVSPTSEEEPTLARIYQIISEYLFSNPYVNMTTDTKLYPTPLKFPPGKIRYLRSQGNFVLFNGEFKRKRFIVTIDLAQNGRVEQFSALHKNECPGFHNAFLLRVGGFFYSLETPPRTKADPVNVRLYVWKIRRNTEITREAHVNLADIEKPTFFDLSPDAKEIVAIGRGKVWERAFIFSNLDQSISQRTIHWSVKRKAFYFGIVNSSICVLATNRSIEILNRETGITELHCALDLEKVTHFVAGTLLVVKYEERNEAYTFDMEERSLAKVIDLPNYLGFAGKEEGAAALLEANGIHFFQIHNNDLNLTTLLTLIPTACVSRFHFYGELLLHFNENESECVTDCALTDFAPFKRRGVDT